MLNRRQIDEIIRKRCDKSRILFSDREGRIVHVHKTSNTRVWLECRAIDVSRQIHFSTPRQFRRLISTLSGGSREPIRISDMPPS